MMKKKKKATSCLSCENFEYDEECGEEVCVMELDEDELYRLSDRESTGCPFYRFRDEYRIVRKQNWVAPFARATAPNAPMVFAA